MSRIFLFLLLSFIASQICGQQYSYEHYTTREGLAGMKVYYAVQDREGYIWFCTETGVSRYDGTSFKNFTVTNGLPDNDILKMFVDTKGRVWMAPFSNTICYYYKGKIYTPANDSLLSKINLTSFVETFTEDSDSTILINTSKEWVTINKKNEIGYPSIIRKVNPTRTDLVTVVPNAYGKGSYVFCSNNFYYYGNDGLTLLDTHLPFYLKGADDFVSAIQPDGKVKRLPMPAQINGWIFEKNKVLYIATTAGAWSVDTLQNRLKDQFLPGKRVSGITVDFEGNLWFTTIDEGVYRLSSSGFRTFNTGNAAENNRVYSICQTANNEVVAGIGYNKIITVTERKTKKVTDLAPFVDYGNSSYSGSKIVSLIYNNDDVLYLSSDIYIFKMEHRRLSALRATAAKYLFDYDGDHLLVAWWSGLRLVRKKDFAIIKDLSYERVTAIAASHNKLYLSRLHGVYELDKRVDTLAYPLQILDRRAVNMRFSPDTVLWIATVDKGLACYKNGKIIRWINEACGLSNNICQSLSMNGNYLWVGTHNGLNKIDTRNPSLIVKYSIADGLPSNDIGAVLATDSVVWTGSPEGLTCFNEKLIATSSVCRLILQSVVSNNAELSLTDAYNLPYDGNNIRFSFAGISFKSAGDIIYHYKMEGLDADWQETKTNSISYPSLPYGSYTFLLQATNKFGVKSSIISLNIAVPAPFWQTWWFRLVALGLLTGAIWIIVSAVYRRRERRIESQNAMKQQIATLEQQALRAQMNPHFIFNCLNSIQHFIISNDLETTNKYLTDFSYLVRKTLDYSTQPFISIADEIKYISTYLDLEQMRFEGKFRYKIDVAGNIQKENTSIPNMVLQPFIENSIRHGMRYKKDSEGLIQVSMIQTESYLICTIEDNGVGRQKAAEMKSRRHIEYQSKGMKLTTDRMKLISSEWEQKIDLEIVDLVDDLENPLGTKIIIKFPLNELKEFYT